MRPIPHRHHAAGKRRIRRRLDRPVTAPSPAPVFTASNIHYDVADKVRALSCGGIVAIHLLVRKLGLAEAIDERLHLLKYHLPYHESDHVLNSAYNALCNGTRLEDIELRRNDLVFLDALGADRIPDPTTSGDFCRRFSPDDVEALQDVFDRTRLKVWKEQPTEFFDEAILDADGTLVATVACCKQGIDIAYDGTWVYHPLARCGPGVHPCVCGIPRAGGMDAGNTSCLRGAHPVVSRLGRMPGPDPYPTYDFASRVAAPMEQWAAQVRDWTVHYTLGSDR